MRATILVGAFAIGALIGLSPAAHAYPSPHCNPSSRIYDSRMCSEWPTVDTACTPYGDHEQCQDDFNDYWRQEHDFYQPVPN